MLSTITKTLSTLSFTLILNTTVNAALVGHYSFDGNANDSSGNNNHGTAVGATLTTDRLGNLNSAYRFNGFDDHILLPLIFSQDQDPLTISAWVKPTLTFEASSIFGEFSPNGGVTTGDVRNYFGLGNNGVVGSLNFDQYPNTGGGAGLDSDWWSRRGDWFHIAVVKDTDVVTMYLNGTSLGSASHTETYTGAAPTLAAIGARPIGNNWSGFGNGEYSFEGDIDEFRIYDNALSVAEIQNLSSVPIPAAVWLFGSAVIGLVGIRRKKA